MIEHVFGGDWTEDKLRRLREYLIAYRAIFTSNPRASYFKTWYVDPLRGPDHVRLRRPQEGRVAHI